MESLGLDTEGMVESTAKLREEIKALSGVDIMENDDTFKSTYQILDELADKWQDLTDIQQASITELLSGKRLGNVTSALMSNFDIARETLETAESGWEGSAERELKNWKKGTQYSLDELKASAQEFATTFLNSDLLKFVIDLGNAFVNVATQLNKIHLLLPAIGAGFAGFKAYKNLDWLYESDKQLYY